MNGSFVRVYRCRNSRSLDEYIAISMTPSDSRPLSAASHFIFLFADLSMFFVRMAPFLACRVGPLNSQKPKPKNTPKTPPKLPPKTEEHPQNTPISHHFSPRIRKSTKNTPKNRKTRPESAKRPPIVIQKDEKHGHFPILRALYGTWQKACQKVLSKRGTMSEARNSVT